MAPRRWLLFALSIASLIVLTYASVLLAFSVAVTPEMQAANPSLAEGRAIVLPVAQPKFVPTFAQDPGNASLLVLGVSEGSFPASAANTSIARALAFAPEDGARTIELRDVPVANGTANLTVSLDALGATGAGFVVKGDAEDAPRFVAMDAVVGRVDHVESTGGLLGLFALGAIGFVAPLVVAIVTHRGGGRRGPTGGIVCRNCRAPLAPDAQFCLRCGEYREERA